MRRKTMKHFAVEQHESVQVWTISNPPMNYMTAPMSRELLELVGRAAEKMGMVNWVLAPETLMPFAMGWARTLAKRPPRAVAAIKRAVYLGADRDLQSGLYVERMEMTQLMCSEDARTIMTAYNEAVARDPMAARSEFLKGIGVPPAKGS